MAVSYSINPYPSILVRSLVLTGYAIVVFVTVALTKWSVGFPVRSLVSLGMVTLLGVASVPRSKRAFTGQYRLIVVALALATWGSLLAILNGGEILAVVQVAIEVHFQSIVTILLVAIVCEWCGAKPTVWVFLLAIGLSALFAVGQFVGFTPAWQASRLLQAYQDTSQVLQTFPGEEATRPLGISFSQTIFSGQICLALAAYALLRIRVSTNGTTLVLPVFDAVGGMVAIFVIAILSGNRSPILGVAVFAVIFFFQKKPLAFLVLVPLFLLAGLAVNPLLELGQSAGLRVAETGDTSSLGRATLVRYGLMLFADRPLGYGTLFDSTTLWRPYYIRLSSYPGVDLITFVPLHNYVISMMNIYGIAFVLAIPAVLYWTLRRGTISLLFIPYIVHCLFHNSGPFFNEVNLWFLLGSLPAFRTEAMMAATATSQLVTDVDILDRQQARFRGRFPR